MSTWNSGDRRRVAERLAESAHDLHQVRPELAKGAAMISAALSLTAIAESLENILALLDRRE